MLTAAFVALGVVGWIVTTFSIGEASLSPWPPTHVTELYASGGVNGLAICDLLFIPFALFSALFLVLSAGWALRALRPALFAAVDISDAIQFSTASPSNPQQDDPEAMGPTKQFRIRKAYMDWRCLDIRGKLNEATSAECRNAWINLRLGLFLLGFAWFAGLLTRL